MKRSAPRAPSPTIDLTRRRFSQWVLACAFVLTTAAMAAPSAAEGRLIEALIDWVATSPQVVFLRNGSAATAADAAKHLRDKYAYYREDIATAEDFIRLCGTKSTMSGQPYAVRLPDGSERPAAVVLTARLHELRSKGPGKS